MQGLKQASWVLAIIQKFSYYNSGLSYRELDQVSFQIDRTLPSSNSGMSLSSFFPTKIFSAHPLIFQTHVSVPEEWWVKITPHERYLISLQVISQRKKKKKTKLTTKDGFFVSEGNKEREMNEKEETEENKKEQLFI